MCDAGYLAALQTCSGMASLIASITSAKARSQNKTLYHPLVSDLTNSGYSVHNANTEIGCLGHYTGDAYNPALVLKFALIHPAKLHTCTMVNKKSSLILHCTLGP